MTAIATAGSSDDGFVPRQLADIQKAMNEDIAEIVDPRTGEKPFQNEKDDTITQQTIAEFAEATASTENAAAIAFAMRDPLTATGAGLSALVQLNAILRKAGASTIITITLEGDPATLIGLGSIISNPNGDISFSINENIVIPQSGIAQTTAICTAFGPIEPEAETIVAIQTPVPGWRSVINGETISVGKEEETDLELRRRQQQSTNATSYRQIEAIRAAILNIPGVTFCRTYQNSTLQTDERGIPGKTLACVVVGGDNRAIAEAILYRVPLGIGCWGNVGETFYDAQGMAETVQFSRPVEHQIHLRITISIVVDENIQIFPSDGPERIKAAIVKFANEGSNACEPLGNPGFPPGQDIIIKWLDTPINSVGGSDIVSVEVAIDDGEFSTGNIPIAWDEIGIFSEERIQVKFL